MALAVTPDPGNPNAPSGASLSTCIEFAFDSAALTSGAWRDLDVVAGALNGPELMAVQRLPVEEHNDARGGADYNMQLSRRRADAVVAYLMRCGVAWRPTGCSRRASASTGRCGTSAGGRPAAAGGVRARVLNGGEWSSGSGEAVARATRWKPASGCGVRGRLRQTDGL